MMLAFKVDQLQEIGCSAFAKVLEKCQAKEIFGKKCEHLLAAFILKIGPSILMQLNIKITKKRAGHQTVHP